MTTARLYLFAGVFSTVAAAAFATTGKSGISALFGFCAGAYLILSVWEYADDV